ncbi:MAG: response regulator [Polyangiaceae bacterium]
MHELVRLHGGRVSVASELGKGTTFQGEGTARQRALGERASAAERFSRSRRGDGDAVRGGSLALVRAAVGRRRGAAAQQLPAAQRSTAPRILVVDDNADMRDYLTRLLREQYQVVSASRRPRGAASSSARSSRTLVLSDVMMPNLDGFGLLTRAARRTRRPCDCQ